ncbi:hypothetical protein HDU81_007712 [Chytriomyces hyalinus]|nr:hypothetical protein HDU81_007712 [Chytriomyces hyalinus]
MLLILQLVSLAILSHAQTLAGKGQPCGGGFQSGTTNAVCEASLICTASSTSPGTYTCEPNVKENGAGVAGDACGGTDGGGDCAAGLVCLKEGDTGVCRAIQNETESVSGDSGGATSSASSEVVSTGTTGSVLQASESGASSVPGTASSMVPAASTSTAQSVAPTGSAASSPKPTTSMSTFATANIQSSTRRDFMAFPLFVAVAISCIL